VIDGGLTGSWQGPATGIDAPLQLSSAPAHPADASTWGSDREACGWVQHSAWILLGLQGQAT